MLWRGAAIAAAAIALAVTAPASGADSPTRYSLAGGCWSLETAGGQAVTGGSKLRLQATTLGSYLLYTTDQKYLAAQGDGSVAPDDQASPAADWRVKDADGGTFTLSPASQSDSSLAYSGSQLSVGSTASRFSFIPATGCPAYPEAELDAHGTPPKGEFPYGTVGGYLEGHNHWMNWEFLGGDFECGRAWHAYGIPYAFPDCSSVEGPEGLAAPVQNFLNYGNPAQPHDTRGWPFMTEWGAHNLTYHGVYWRWVQRAYMAGLRMMVMPINENRVLCELLPMRRNSCDEMDSVRLALKDIRELQAYVDAQAGGPGKGFFQVVTTPEDARRVINEGKMAVVLEIEVSELFGCRGWDTSTCDTKQIDRELNEVYGAGVRSSLLLNKFDNPLVGVRFDSGPVGVLINGGNHQSAGSFWSAETCKTPFHDNEIYAGDPTTSATLAGLLAQLGVTSGTVPAYPPAPHCNTRGLTDLGRYLEKRMIEKHMIINPDHMSQRGVDDTLTLLEAHHYSGVISPHGWMDPLNWPRLWKLGGLAFPDSDTSTTFVKAWKIYRPVKTPYMLGWGYGADLGGLAAQPDGRAGAVKYPFKSYDGSVTLDKQRTGMRTFDYNTEGVAHYGLYADWFDDVDKLGGPKMAADMWNGAEAYLEMWERADGVPVRGCGAQDVGMTPKGLGLIRLRDDWTQLLRRAGQPKQRTRVWTWCVKGRRSRTAADVAELTSDGAVELAGSTGYGRGVRGVEVGARKRRLARKHFARSIGHGLWLRSAGRGQGATYVFATRNRRVVGVGVATSKLAKNRVELRAAMKRLLAARTNQDRREFVPNGSPESLPTNAQAQPQAAFRQADPRLTRALEILCGFH